MEERVRGREREGGGVEIKRRKKRSTFVSARAREMGKYRCIVSRTGMSMDRTGFRCGGRQETSRVHVHVHPSGVSGLARDPQI